MSCTLNYGVPDTIPIGVCPDGNVMKHIEIPSGQFMELQALNLKMVTADEPAAFVFHITVHDSAGIAGQVFWVYARRQKKRLYFSKHVDASGVHDDYLDIDDPEAYQTQNFDQKIMIAGPAQIDFVVINQTGKQQALFWAAMFNAG